MEESKKRLERLTYTVEETAAVLGLGICNVYNLCHSRGFPAVRVGGRWIIPRNKLDEWLDKQAEGGDTD